MILPLIIVGLFVFALIFIGVSHALKPESDTHKEDDKKVTFGEVFQHYELNGYLENCKETDFKYVVGNLRSIMRTSKALQQLDIAYIGRVITLPRVGEKTYSLITHLSGKYIFEKTNF